MTTHPPRRYVGGLIGQAGGTLRTDITVLRNSAASGLGSEAAALGRAERKLEAAEARLAAQIADFERAVAAEVPRRARKNGCSLAGFARRHKG